jgi:hypothetical protein
MHPSSDDFPMAKQMDSETLARFHQFSEPAKATARQWVLVYARKLIHASFTAKEGVDGDNVSEANVNEAAYSLNGKQEKGFKRLAGIVGGIFLGNGLSSLVTVIQSGRFDRNGIIFMAVSGILGAFLVAVHLPQSILPKWRRRTPSRPPFKVKRRPVNQASGTPKA